MSCGHVNFSPSLQVDHRYRRPTSTSTFTTLRGGWRWLETGPIIAGHDYIDQSARMEPMRDAKHGLRIHDKFHLSDSLSTSTKVNTACQRPAALHKLL